MRIRNGKVRFIPVLLMFAFYANVSGFTGGYAGYRSDNTPLRTSGMGMHGHMSHMNALMYDAGWQNIIIWQNRKNELCME